MKKTGIQKGMKKRLPMKAMRRMISFVLALLLLVPVLEWDSKAFEYVMKYAGRQGTEIAVPQEGDVLRLGGATVTVLRTDESGTVRLYSDGENVVFRE